MRITRVGGEEPDRVVAPVTVTEERVNGQKLYRSHPERLDIFYDLIGQTFVSPAPFLRQSGMELGVAAEVKLVDDRVVPRDGVAFRFALPVEIRVDDNAFWHERGAVALVEGGVVAGFQLIPEDRGVPLQIAEMSAGIRIEHQLVGIEAVPGRWLVRAVHAVPVYRSGTDIGDIAVPDLV